MRRLTALAACLTLAAAGPVLADSSLRLLGHGPRPPAGFWVAGDLHVHTIYGHDTCIDPTTAWDPSSTDRAARRSCEAPYTVGFTPAQRLQEAQQRGLNFVALTDHNNVVNQTDPDALAFQAANPELRVAARLRELPDRVTSRCSARAPATATTARSPARSSSATRKSRTSQRAGETALADGLRAAGGVFQINHPSDTNWLRNFGYSVVPDNVEVWNEPWFYQSPAPGEQRRRLRHAVVRRLPAARLSRRHHRRQRLALGDDRLGARHRRPDHMGLRPSLTVQGVLDGLRAHRTFVSALPPLEHGPQLFLEADHNGDGVYEAIAGSDTSPRSSFRVRTVSAVPGSTLRIVTDQGSVDVPLGAATSYDFRLGSGGIPAGSKFVRAQLFGPDGRTSARRAVIRSWARRRATAATCSPWRRSAHRSSWTTSWLSTAAGGERRAEQLQPAGRRRVEPGQLDDAPQPVVQRVRVHVQRRRGRPAVEVVVEIDLEGERQIGVALERFEQLRRDRPARRWAG